VLNRLAVNQRVVVRARYGVVVRVLMTTMLVGLAGFFSAMSVLVSHESFLACTAPDACAHVERYPFGVVQSKPLSPVKRADVRWSTGGRSAALKLVLDHADGVRTEYPGVGTNGERAEDVADAVNAYLGGAQGAKEFQLRERSLPVAAFLLVLALVGLVLTPHFFTRVRLERTPSCLEVRVGRWPAKTRLEVVPLTELGAVAIIERVVNGQPFFGLVLERRAGPPVDLGLSFRSDDAARAEAGLVADAMLSS
jgi:hypothetical protein